MECIHYSVTVSPQSERATAFVPLVASLTLFVFGFNDRPFCILNISTFPKILWVIPIGVFRNRPLSIIIKSSAYPTTIHPCPSISPSISLTTRFHSISPCRHPDSTLPSSEVSSLMAVTVCPARMWCSFMPSQGSLNGSSRGAAST